MLVRLSRAGTGTQPLPIYLAHFNAQHRANAGNAALYTGTNWTNTTLVGRLSQLEPAPTTAANDLFGDATRRANMLAAGLPSNFWVMNPVIGDANVTTSGSFTKYHSVQTEVRRRLSRGLLVNGSYTWSRRYSSNLDSLHFDRVLRRATNVPHSFKVNGYYELPVGRGKRFGTDMPQTRRHDRRRLVSQRHRAHAAADALHQQRHAGGDDDRRVAGRVSIPDRSRPWS